MKETDMSKTIRVHSVLFDGPENGPSGPAGDGTFIKRFGPRDAKAAETFASENTYYGRPAKVNVSQVSRRLAQRWGLA